MKRDFTSPLSSAATTQCEVNEKQTDSVAAEIARRSAFASLVDRHAGVMYRVAFSLLRSTEDAQDAVQKTFLKLYRGNAWRHMNDERAFLARAVWRVALNRLPKRKQPALGQSGEQFAEKADTPEANAIKAAEAAHLRQLIDSLPDDLRQVLLLSAIDDLNSREVAILLDIPEGTVRTSLMRARAELRKRFGVQKDVKHE